MMADEDATLLVSAVILLSIALIIAVAWRRGLGHPAGDRGGYLAAPLDAVGKNLNGRNRHERNLR